MQISTFDAKTHLSALLDKILRDGESITITRRGQPVAHLTPVRKKKKPDPKVKKAIAAINRFSKKHTLGKNITIRELIGRDSH